MGSYHYLNDNRKKNYDNGVIYNRPGTAWNRLSLSSPNSFTNFNTRALDEPEKKFSIYYLNENGGGEGDGDAQKSLQLRDRQNSSHQLGKDRIKYNIPSEPDKDEYKNVVAKYSTHDKIWDERETKKIPLQSGQSPITKLKRSTCKFCDATDNNGVCQCPIHHLPAVHSRYMRALEDRSRNSVAINVFRNGENRVAPSLIQIPKRNMQSMEEVMKVIDGFVKFPVGYPHALYTLGGDIISDPQDIKPYETYVVVNNCKRQFIHMEYGYKKPSALCQSRRRRFCPGSFNVSISHLNRQ